jgi:hypothetical protein
MKNTTSQVQIQSTLSKPLEIHNGLRQGDALAGLFNVALETAVRIQTARHIFSNLFSY